ncbi:MAG: hypothetical protein E3J71_02355 [Candidatus Stahlbacteria bacterium]|nr:MAG: hypothetical protein E3J71_02355 [Candidatus Stahlbacteria bacterium]
MVNLGRDIKLELDYDDGRILDVFIEDGDFALQECEDCLKQDLLNELWCQYYDWALAYTVGSRLPEFVNMPMAGIVVAGLYNAIREPLQREDRLIEGRYNIRLTEDGFICGVFPKSRIRPREISLVIRRMS